jgi:2-methylfumaryl-CoA isomerase
MPGLLNGLRVVEVSAFVAAPLGGMTLAQMGAEVIRIDPIKGPMDYGRWPITADGKSLFWAGLNKAKRSVALDFGSPEGREIAASLATAPGENGGILLTNLSATGWMSYARLATKRPDLIMLTLTGNHDGSTAVDYTVNPAVGFPMVTGSGGGPVNHVLPAWDMAAGLHLVAGLLAAERHRRLTGEGQEVTIALSDVALAMVGNLGFLAEVQVNHSVRQPIGNDLYGGFGRDFATADGRRVMLFALTNRMWRSLCDATGLGDKMAMIGPMLDLDLDDEGGRFRARDVIAAVLAPWCAARTLDQIREVFSGTGVLWAPYQDFGQLMREDPRCSTANPLFQEVEQPGIGRYLMPGSPVAFSAAERGPVRPAPALGEHTDAVLADVLGLSSAEIGRLHDAGVVSGPRA